MVLPGGLGTSRGKDTWGGGDTWGGEGATRGAGKTQGRAIGSSSMHGGKPEEAARYWGEISPSVRYLFISEEGMEQLWACGESPRVCVWGGAMHRHAHARAPSSVAAAPCWGKPLPIACTMGALTRSPCAPPPPAASSPRPAAPARPCPRRWSTHNACHRMCAKGSRGHRPGHSMPATKCMDNGYSTCSSPYISRLGRV